MVGGLTIKYRKKEGFFCKRIKRVEGLFWKKRKRGGATGKNALLLPLSRDQNRVGGEGGVGGLVRRPWGSAAAVGRGKGRGGRGGSFPPLNLGGGGLWRCGHDGGQRRAAAAVVAALRDWGGATAAVVAVAGWGDPVAPLTLGGDGARRRLCGGRRRRAELCVAAALGA